MKKIFICLFLISTGAFCQNLSPLLAPMTTNVMNDKPEIVRKLQLNLDEQIRGTKSGFTADIINKKLIDFRDLYFNKIEPPTVTSVINDEKILIDINIPYDMASIKIDLKGIDTSLTLETLLKDKIEEGLIKKYFREPLEKVLEKLNIGNELKQNILYGIYALLVKNDLVRGIERIPDESEAKDNYIKAISNISSKILIRQIQEKVVTDEKFSTIDLSMPVSKWGNDKIKDLTKILDEYLKSNTDRLKISLLNIFGDVQIEINKIIDQINKILVAGNIGLAVSEGSGDFGTGLQVTYNINSRFQGGMYFNGDLSESDSTLPMNSLVAVQLRYLIGDKLQVESLGSFYFGSTSFKAFRYYDVGGGFSVNTGKSIILGAGYFQEGNSNLFGNSQTTSIATVRSLAIFVRSTTPTLPAIYIGSSWQGDSKANFGFKVSYPLNNKN